MRERYASGWAYQNFLIAGADDVDYMPPAEPGTAGIELGYVF